MHARERIGVLYAADLLGAGLGAAVATGLLFLLPAESAIRIAAIAGAVAAMLPAGKAVTRLALPSIAVIAALALPQGWLAPRITEFKPLPRTLAVIGAEVVAEHSSPYGLLTVVRNDAIPFRHAPGRSLAATTEVPRQLAVFTDGDSMTALTAHDGRESLAWLDETTSALPYHLLCAPTSAGAGRGWRGGGAASRLSRRARDHAVELNPAMLDALALLAGRPAACACTRAMPAVSRAPIRGSTT